VSDRDDTSVRDGLVISYLTLRAAVGIVGVALPPVLSGGCLLLGDCRSLERSISSYYGTGMRDVFVGLLFAIAFFMFLVGVCVLRAYASGLKGKLGVLGKP